MSDYWEKLETQSVQDASINPYHQTKLCSDNHRFFHQLKDHIRLRLKKNADDPSNPLKVFEIGAGAGFSALSWLSTDTSLEVTSIDKIRNPYVESNMRKLCNWYTHRFKYELIGSDEYDYRNDPNFGLYDVVCIDTSFETLEYDLVLAKKMNASFIWVMNTDQEPNKNTPIINEFIGDRSEYRYTNNLQYVVTSDDSPIGFIGIQSSEISSKVVNTSLLERTDIYATPNKYNPPMNQETAKTAVDPNKWSDS